MRIVKIKLFDSFTNQIFGGNVAGVVTKADSLTSDEMQKIAAEVSAPTTGFITKANLRKKIFNIRFFTPSQEIDLCGHVTVAVFSALVWERIIRAKKGKYRAIQRTKAGDLSVEINILPNGKVLVGMVQKLPSFKKPNIRLSQITKLLGIKSRDVERKLPLEIVSTGLYHLFIPIKSLQAIRKLKPNFNGLARLGNLLKVQTIVPFSLETVNPASDVHLRDICAPIGTDEEAASGTTNGALASYLFKHNALKKSLGNNETLEMRAEQGFEMGRPSEILTRLTVKGSSINQVCVIGEAVCTLSGEIKF